MCGLAGFSGMVPVDPIKLNFLLYFNERRGDHSTGIYANKTLIKDAIGASSFVLRDDYKEAIEGASCVVGHTRFATMGAKNAINAHPYEFGEGRWKIVGTHNGWLLPTMLDDFAELYDLPVPEVDSMLIFQILEKTKHDLKALNTLGGAMALAWVRDNKLHLYRRSSKPLYFGYIKGEGIYYSSESYPLQLIRCDNIGMLQKNIVNIVQDGKILDGVALGDPELVPSLPMNATAHTWRQGLPTKEVAQVPAVSKKWRNEKKKEEHTTGRNVGFRQKGRATNRHFETNRENHTGKKSKLAQAVEEDALTGACYPVRMRENTNSHDDQKELVKKRRFLNSIVDRKEFMAEWKQQQFLDWDQGDNVCYILTKVVDSKTQNPVSNFPLYVDKDPTTLPVKTNFKGYAVIQVLSDNVIGDTVRVLTQDPLTTKVYYSTKIPTKQSRVMEVTLSIPFRSKEEAAACNESSSGAVNTHESTKGHRKVCPVIPQIADGARTGGSKGSDSEGHGSEDTDNGRSAGFNRGRPGEDNKDSSDDYQPVDVEEVDFEDNNEYCGTWWGNEHRYSLTDEYSADDEETRSRIKLFDERFNQQVEKDNWYDQKREKEKREKDVAKKYSKPEEVDNTIYLLMLTDPDISPQDKVTQLRTKLRTVYDLLETASKSIDVDTDETKLRGTVTSLFHYLTAEKGDLEDYINDIIANEDDVVPW